MSFHLEGPWLTTIGKRKSKRKYRNAANAARSRELQSSWKEILERHGVADSKAKRKSMTKTSTRQPLSYRGSDQPRIPSLPFSGATCAKPQDKVYTGTAMVGVAVMHKSCLQPVFNKEAAVDAAKMRR